MEFKKSERLANVNYAIRGPVHEAALRLEAAGEKILKLNIGNPASFGFDASDVIKSAIAGHLNDAGGYCHSRGLVEAKESVKKYASGKGVEGVTEDDIYIGNGGRELISMVMQALVNPGDEVLVPSPDYPLWTATVNLASGKAVHYICDELSEWNPDIEDIKSRITPKTKALVLINPNNPTGSVYSVDVLKQIIEICRKHNLVLLSDEIYDRIVYDGKKHVSPASLSNEILHISFNGLSKVFRVCGFSLGWMVVSGIKKDAADFIGGLKVLSSLRPGSSVFAHAALRTALEFDNSINQLIEPGGRLREQRDTAWKLLNEIPGITCVKPYGSLYMFPKIDTAKFNIKDDMKFILDLLNTKKILFVQGTGFNWIRPDHFRVVFLPEVKEIESAMLSLKDFLSTYRQ